MFWGLDNNVSMCAFTTPVKEACYNPDVGPGVMDEQ